MGTKKAVTVVAAAVDEEDETGTTLELWSQVKVAVADLEKDIQKNGVKQNCSAGIRVRHGARDLAKLCKTLARACLDADKKTKEARTLAKAAKKTAAAS